MLGSDARRFVRRGGVEPDAVTVDALARLHLAAVAVVAGCARDASPELCELVAFAGLDDLGV